MNKIAVICVAYKPIKKQLQNLIEQIKDQGINKKNIFIKDNTHDNVGYGEAINKIVRKHLREFDYFLILNPDVSLYVDCIRQLVSCADSNNRIGIVGPNGGKIDSNRFSSILLPKKTNKKGSVMIVDYISGSAMLIKSEVFKRVGLFDKDYFLYYEEVDFCFRAKKAGFRIVVCTKAKVKHFESTYIGKDSPAMTYYLSRNHLLFVERFAPWPIKIREFVRLPKTIYQARSSKYELLGIKDYFLRNLGRNYAIKAKVDL